MGKYRQLIEENLYSCDVSHRWGSIKVDVSSLFPEIQDEQPIMGASQNYLGGGMLWSISSWAMFDWRNLTPKNQEIYRELAEEIKRYMHEMTNHVGDEWEEATYESTQTRPNSAY